ncbi:hypothetical protein F980_00974 [Acinetobacter lwoffii NIPH 715]|nr:hypothetical protein F980_00974 [Acinetobacter lwoffii NIPH 715]
MGETVDMQFSDIKKQLFQPLFLQNLDFILLRLFHNHG